ncbi:unnamed protein product [Cunninghamella blakesleeana]
MSTGKENKSTNANNSLSEAEKFLESLNLPNTSSNNNTTDKDATKQTAADPNDIMNFLDEISKYPSEQQQPTDTQKESISEPTPQNKNSDNNTNDNNNASAAVKTTTDQINRTVQSAESKALLEDQVKHLQSFVNKDTIEKLGTNLRQLSTQLLETVAPPISEHELVEIWLSHDMIGYSGVEALVYRAFARVMEQTETGQVIVRKGIDDGENNEDAERDLNMCEGMLEGIKLAKANVDHLIKLHYTKPEASTTYDPQSGSLPVINCPVFMVIQPVKYTVSNDGKTPYQLVYAIVLEDPTNQLSFQAYSQSIPLTWLDIPYEENEWVEDKMVDVLRMAVTTIAQDYVYTRMSSGKQIIHDVQETLKEQQNKEEKQS